MKSIHGGDIYNNKVNMDFSVNINPLGIPHSVKEAMSDALSYADRYPDMACSGLEKKRYQSISHSKAAAYKARM